MSLLGQTAKRIYSRVEKLRSLLSQPAQSNTASTIDPTIWPTAQNILDEVTPSLAKKVFLETYGCQMNLNDSEIVMGILGKSGRFDRAFDAETADIVLLMTCAIRENAETKIWNRLDTLNAIEKRKKGSMTVGVLGCMAERLKTELMEKKRNVDVVCGPDAYRDLPRLLNDAASGTHGINVMLSADETYADIAPVRLDHCKRSAFVSIMRGCNNMCTFCIVPFTRGRERSRPIHSILDEVRRLSDQGVKEITLLGQNVNSYCDESPLEIHRIGRPIENVISKGFSSTCKPKTSGLSFVDLLDQVSLIDPDMRIRFTSPHPKNFPDELLFLIRDRPNICKQIHLPAQSGSSTVLDRMRRGYTREAYLELVCRIREVIPNIAISSDFISGFCGETEEDHEATVSLIENVNYDMAYMYAYSMREKTAAHRRYIDDVPEEVKQRRLNEMIRRFYSMLASKATRSIGSEELVLVEGPSKKSESDLCGRIDSGRMVVFPKSSTFDLNGVERTPSAGDYVKIRIVSVNGVTPVASVLGISSLKNN